MFGLDTGSTSLVCGAIAIRWKIWINGVKERELANSELDDVNLEVTDIYGQQDPQTPVYVGFDPAYTGADFHGEMEDLRIYKRALSQTEIVQLASPAFSAGLAMNPVPKMRSESLQSLFVREYQDYLNQSRAAGDLATKARLWQEICQKWSLDPNAGTALRWLGDRVIVVD